MAFLRANRKECRVSTACRRGISKPTRTSSCRPSASSEQQRATVQLQHQGPPQQAQASPTPQPQHSPTPGQVLPQVNNGRQGSPNVRNVLNGGNQQNFMANAQALMAQFGGGANGASALNALQNAGLPRPGWIPAATDVRSDQPHRGSRDAVPAEEPERDARARRGRGRLSSWAGSC